MIKDKRLEIRLNSIELERINFLVKKFGFDSRSQCLIYLINEAAIKQASVCFCGGKVIEMTEQNGQKEGWFVCSKCGLDFDRLF